MDTQTFEILLTIEKIGTVHPIITIINMILFDYLNTIVFLYMYA